MEKYADFLAARTVNHLIGQALDFVSRKDPGSTLGWHEHGNMANIGARAEGPGREYDHGPAQ